MSQAKPEKIIVEFTDGTKAAVSFDALPAPLQRDILSQPFASQPNSNLEKGAFLLLEWEDGWKEVFEVDSSCREINRYYVISRQENVGRLSLNKEGDYPELIEVGRKPLDLKKITFVDTFQLTLGKSKREGKKTDHSFTLNKGGDGFKEEIDSFKKVVAEQGFDLQKLRTQNSAQLPEEYEKIRKKMGIRAGQRQQDVFDFIAYLAKVAS
jgi:hypothetical protein